MLKKGYLFVINATISTNQLLFLAILVVVSVFIIPFIVFSVRKRRSENEADNEQALLPENINAGYHNMNVLFNSLNDIVLEFDERKVCRNVWYNKTRNWPMDPELFRGKTVTETLGAEKASRFNQAIEEVIETQQAITLEFPSISGAGRWYSAKLNPVFDDEGNYTRRVTSTVIDITKQKKHENTTDEIAMQLFEAQSIAKIGDWWFDTATFKNYWSENMYAILEAEDTSLENKFEFYLNHVHQEDHDAVASYFKKLPTTSRTLEHRIYTAKGHLLYVKLRKGREILNPDGKTKKITGIFQDITETRLAEKMIKRSRAELLDAQTIAKIGNWKWSFLYKRLTCSDEICRIYEIDQTLAVKGNSFRLILTYVHPDDKAALKRFLKDEATNHGATYSYRIVTPGGNLKYLTAIIGKTTGQDEGSFRQIFGTVQDVTDRRLAEIDQQKTEDKYRLVLETIKLAAVTLDKNGTITFCNKYLANLLGYEQNELLGLNWFRKFVPAELHPVFAEWYSKKAFLSEFVNPVICRDGQQRIVNWQNTVSFGADGQIKETTSIGEDITEQQKDRQSLISAKEEAEKSSRFKSEFLSAMSHEIRTPMNAVIGVTNLLIDENPKPEQLAYLDTLKFSGENLLGIINDILDYNRIEAGKLTLNQAPFNLHQLIASIRQSFYVKAAEKNLNIYLHIDDSIPANLKGDTVRLSQILNNLLSNALKFTNKGSVSIGIKEKSRKQQNILIEFVISDTGIGIDNANLGKIFDPFTQEEQITDYGGSGLGLAITKRLVELHQSEIMVSSELEKGTQFAFSIAFEILEQPIAVPQPPAPTASQMSLKGMKVLVVDDNEMNVLIACRFLKRWQVETDQAENGQIAVDKFKKNNYDLIIMDLQMPVMDGMEATRLIKAINPGMPIIALTADAMPETYNKAMEIGMNDYLTKPFKQEVLFEKVSRFYKAGVVG